MIVSLTLFQSPPPSIVVVTKNPDQTLKATVSLATAWPVGTGLAWFEGGRVLTDRWSSRLSLVIPASTLENKKVIAELQRMGTAQVPFSVSAGVPGLGGGTSPTGTGAGASGAGSGGGARPAVQGTPPKVAVDAATLQQLEKDGVLSAAQSAAFGAGLATGARLTDAQRQELLGLVVGDAASHEPPDMALTRAQLDQLFDFIRANPSLLKDLPETAPPIDRELRIKAMTRLLDSLGATQAKPPDPNAFGSGSGAGGGLSASDRQLLQDYKAKYGDPTDVEEPGSAAEPLTSTHKFRIALRLSVRWMPAGAGAELDAMLHSAWFWAGVAVGIGAYVALWLFPEPIISKSLAAGITIALLSLYGVSEIIAVAKAWMALSDDCDHAISLADLELAAEKFGRAAGAVGARILVTLATILIGGKVLPKRLPPPPGAPIAVQQVVWGAAGQGAALSTVPALVVDWQVAAAQSAWAIKVLANGSVVIVSSGQTLMMASTGGTGGQVGPARAKGAPEPIGPKDGTPTGRRAQPEPNDDADTIRSLNGENKAAEVLAKEGYPTEQNPAVTYKTVKGGPAKPDLKVSGYIFDVYSPGKGKRLDGIWSEVADKIDRGQTRRVVVFLDDWILGKGANRLELTKYLQKAARQRPGLEQILIVLKGKVHHIYP